MTRPNTRKNLAPRIAAALANGVPIRWREVAKASAVHPLAGLQPVIVAANGAPAGIVTLWHSRTMGQPT